MSNGLIAPHGGALVSNMASEQERAHRLPQVALGSRRLADLEMLATGAYSPLGVHE
jgi:sulfate adenylyltransferase